MPLPVVHLYLAKKVEERLQRDLGAYYYLGSISPDAIHARKGTNRKDKHKTHLFVIDQQLGEKSWQSTEQNILEFVKIVSRHEDSSIRHFGYGYCLHALLDMHWIRNIFLPLDRALRSGGLNFDDIRRLYYDESRSCDILLYRQHDWLDNLLDRISQTPGLDFFDILKKNEIEAWKKTVVGNIKNPTASYLVEPAYIKSDVINSFIEGLVPGMAELYTLDFNKGV